MLDLSIIIVNFNTKDLVLECLDSIHKFRGAVSLEVIVVDNASTDGSARSLEQLEIRLIRNLTNVGYAKANNQGARISKGKYLLLLNSDTIVKKDALEKLVKFAESHSEAGVVGAKLLNIDGSLQSSCFRFSMLGNAIKYVPGGSKAQAVDAVVGAAFLVTPEAKKKVGLLDERYWAYFEDLAYCREVRKKGLKVYYLPSAEIIHYHGMSFKQLAEGSEQWKKLIPGSIIYHGYLKHYLISSVLWLGQKWQKLIG